MTGALSIDHFAEFFSEVHGHFGPHRGGGRIEPFKWQTRLAEEVWDRGRWYQTIDIPTGAGKTSVVLIAAFLLALDAGQPQEDRWMPRRIAMVVDRRVIVDQAYLEARALLDSLKGQRDPGSVLGAVANSLRSLWGGPEDADPVRADMLRGGIVRDESWARRPDRPAILASTVDQVGSRLLFRGYGLSSSMAPIHAGLMGNDVLLFLDEVHLARPFADTLQRLVETYQTWGELDVRNRWQVSELSATPRQPRSGGLSDPDDRFGLSLAGASDDPSALLHRRLDSTKVANLELVKVPKTDRVKADVHFAERCAAKAIEVLSLPQVRTVAVIVNRVDTARRVHQELKATGALGGFDVVLVTGRMREADREPLMEVLKGRLRTGRNRAEDASLVVVATQCIEAGADFDFDAVVTECASLDALRQRMGRLDRDGELTANGTPGVAWVLARSASVSSVEDDPIYGSSLRETWEWLNRGRGGVPIDFGWTAWQCQDISSEEINELSAPSSASPVLLPAHLDLWVQTQPRPVVDPDVAMWLHGIDREIADVQILWRDDITPELLKMASRAPAESVDGADQSETALVGTTEMGTDVDPVQCLRDLLAFRPPASSETMSVPVGAVRAWLTKPADRVPEGADEVADVDGGGTPEPPPPRRRMRPVAIWDGDRTRVAGRLDRISPGSVLVAPASYGGMGRDSYEGCEYGWWDPTAEEPVPDVGDRAQLRQRNVAVLRLLRSLPSGGEVPLPRKVAEDEDEDALAVVEDWIDHVEVREENDASGAVRTLKEALKQPTDRVTLVELRSMGTVGERDLSEPWFAVSYCFPPDQSSRKDRLVTLDLEPETSSFVGSRDEVRLDEHLRGVEHWARRFAQNCSLDEPLVTDLALSGRLHDLGKADPRFQAMLRGGIDRLESEELLAKSSIAASERAGRRQAQRRSGYPPGTRHELLSLALIAGASSIAEQANDWDLVCHLVASHHGYCRPFAPYAPDDSPRTVEIKSDPWTLSARTDHGLERLDSGVADRFWCLVRRYGWFRLAWFEAILRLADHRRSEQEQEDLLRRSRGGKVE